MNEIESPGEKSEPTSSFMVNETELTPLNTGSINAAMEKVTEITMSSVATMIRPSTVENTVMELEGADEISATSLMDSELIVDPALVEEKIDVPNVMGDTEVVEENSQEQCPIAEAVPEKEEPVVASPKPVKVYHKPGEEYLEPPEEKHKILSGWSNKETH